MSQQINWNDAKTLILNYQNDSNIHIPTAGNRKLKGLMVDATDIASIINNPNEEIEKVFMIFGMTEDPTQGKQVTIVLTGVNSNDELIIDNSYEYCDPCPDVCGDLSSHL